MAKGNCYIMYRKTKRNDQVPALFRDKWNFRQPTFDNEGNVTGDEKIHPTWRQAARRLKRRYGAAIEFEYKNREFILVEMEFSFIKGEITELQKLQKNTGLGKDDFRILTHTEAKKMTKEGIDVFTNGR